MYKQKVSSYLSLVTGERKMLKRFESALREEPVLFFLGVMCSEGGGVSPVSLCTYPDRKLRRGRVH